MNGHDALYPDFDEMPPDTDGMLEPARCNHCRQVYDLCAGKPIQRYVDCTVFETPCCRRVVDDRAGLPFPAFTRLRDER